MNQFNEAPIVLSPPYCLLVQKQAISMKLVCSDNGKNNVGLKRIFNCKPLIVYLGNTELACTVTENAVNGRLSNSKSL